MPCGRSCADAVAVQAVWAVMEQNTWKLLTAVLGGAVLLCAAVLQACSLKDENRCGLPALLAELASE